MTPGWLVCWWIWLWIGWHPVSCSGTSSQAPKPVIRLGNPLHGHLQQRAPGAVVVSLFVSLAALATLSQNTSACIVIVLEPFRGGNWPSLHELSTFFEIFSREPSRFFVGFSQGPNK